MKGFRAAVGLLTRVPSRPGPETERAIPWLPVVGLLIGAAVAGLYALLRDAITPLAAAAVAIGGGALLTGGFHEDGLADTADAFGADVSRERRLEILKDPHYGTFGILALAFTVVARIAALAALDRWGALAALTAAHALSRAAPAVQLWLLPTATPGGLGATYSQPAGRRRASAAALAGVLAVALLLGTWSIPAVAVAVLAASALSWLALRKIDGITGDVLGATQQLIEIGVLLLCVSAGAVVPWWRAVKGALLVAGTGSDVGKSAVVQGLCRWLRRSGVRVAPFKAQNMSLNSYVTRDGAEIARAQAAQAFAAGVVEPEAAMNPVLLKPVDDRRAQVIVMGKAVGDAEAEEYMDLRPRLTGIVRNAFEDLRARVDVVVCEGAGSLAEINLREGDLPNMGLAGAAGLPVVIVGDIDRGGVFASLYGSVELLDDTDRALIAGFIINRFRGRFSILEPGLAMIETLTRLPVFGVLPWIGGLWTDAEDAVPTRSIARAAQPPLGRDTLDVAVVALRRMSNFTDADAIACEPGVSVRFTRSFGDIVRADLVIVPGTKATVDDLAALRADGLDAALSERVRRGAPILGVCGGYQMLGTRIVDRIESGAGEIEGLGLLPVETIFEPDKVLARPNGKAPAFGNAAVEGYEIHHGRVRRLAGDPLFHTGKGDEGCRAGVTTGTSWHGVFESDGFRAAFLAWVAAERGLDWTPGEVRFDDVRNAAADTLADAIEAHLDTEGLLRVIERGAVPLPSARG